MHCSDDALWAQVKNKRGFMKLARNGEEEHARRRLARVRVLVAEPKVAETINRVEANDPATKKIARPAYRKYGRIPRGVEIDVAAVSAIVDERDRCRAAKDFDRADMLRAQLGELGSTEWGVKVRDDRRTWYVTRYKPLPKQAEGAKPAAKKNAVAKKEPAAKKKPAAKKEPAVKKKPAAKKPQAKRVDEDIPHIPAGQGSAVTKAEVRTSEEPCPTPAAPPPAAAPTATPTKPSSPAVTLPASGNVAANTSGNVASAPSGFEWGATF